MKHLFLSLLFLSLYSIQAAGQQAEFPNVIDFEGLKDTTYLLKANNIKGIPELRYATGNTNSSAVNNNALIIQDETLNLSMYGGRDSLIFTYNLSNLSLNSDSLKFYFSFSENNSQYGFIQIFIRGNKNETPILIKEVAAKKGSFETNFFTTALKKNNQSYSEEFQVLFLPDVNVVRIGLSPELQFSKFELRERADIDVKLETLILPEVSSNLSNENISIKLINEGKKTITTIPLTVSVTSDSDTLIIQETANINILPNDTVIYDLSQEIEFLSYGEHKIKAYSILPDDPYAINDSTTGSVFKTEPIQSLPYFEDFESLAENITYSSEKYLGTYAFIFNPESAYFRIKMVYDDRYELGSSSLNIYPENTEIFEYHGALDLSDYNVNNNQINFDLRYYINYSESEEDKLWVRGSHEDEWLLAQNFSDSSINKIIFSSSNISNLLLNNSQNFTSTFEYKFTTNKGSEYHSFHIDDIAIYEKPTFDLKLNKITIAPESSINKNDSNLVEVVNRGLEPIQEFTIHLGNIALKTRDYEPKLDTTQYEITFQEEIQSGDTVIVKMPPLPYEEAGSYSVFCNVTTNNDAFSNNNSLKISTFQLGRYDGELIYSEDFNSESFQNDHTTDYSYRGGIPNHPGLAIYQNNYDYETYLKSTNKIRLEKIPYQDRVDDKHLLLTLNFEDYETISNQINLEFDLLSIESSRSDSSKVYARGSEYDQWFVLFDWYANKPVDGSWMKLRAINLSDSLFKHGQEFSSTTQIRFTNSINQTNYQQSLDIDNIRVYEKFDIEMGVGEITADRIDKMFKKDSIQVEVINNGKQAVNSFSLTLSQIFPFDSINQIGDTIKLNKDFLLTIEPGDTIEVWMDSIYYPKGGIYDFELNLAYEGQQYLKNNTKHFMIGQIESYNTDLPKLFTPVVRSSYKYEPSESISPYLKENPGVSFYSFDNGFLQISSAYQLSGRNVYGDKTMYNQNLLLTLNLEKYKDIEGYIGMSFDFSERHVLYSDSSKVYIRGSQDKPWLLLYDWFTNKPNSGWKYVEPLNISNILTSNGQELTQETQIRFSLSNYDIDPGYFEWYQDQSLYVKNILLKEVYQNDVSVLASEEEKSFFLDKEDVEFKFTNLGENVQVYFPINIQIDGPNGQQTFETTYNGELFKGDTASITITNRFDFSTPGEYNVTLISELNDDNNRGNDTIRYILNGVDRYQGSLPYFENFENVMQDSIRSFAGNIEDAPGWSFKAFDVKYPDNQIISLNREALAVIKQENQAQGKVMSYQNNYNSEVKNHIVSEAMLIMDLSDYDTTNSNILLSFDYLFSTSGTWYGAINSGGFNRMYLRTNRTEEWIEIYNWYGRYNSSNDWVSVSEINISEILKENNLNFTEGMEFKFPQLNFEIEQFLLDNIQIYEGFSGLNGASSFTINNKHYVVGGTSASGNLNPFTYQYNLGTTQFERRMLFPGEFRRNAISFVIDSIAYYGLGADANYNSLSDFYQFTEASGWQKLNDFPGQARSGAISFVLNNEAYIALGSSSNGALNDFWKYNNSADSWTQLEDVPFDGRSAAFASVVNGRAYVGGGVSTNNGSSFQYSDIQEFDPATATWEEKIYADGINLSFNNATTFSLYDKMYIAYGSKDQITVYDPSENTVNNIGDTLNFGDRRSAPISFVTSDSTALVGLGSYGTFDPVYELEMREFSVPNEIPEAITLSNNIINENSNENSFIGILNTIDADQQNNHQYELLSSDGNIDFTIQADSLFVQGVFDYESISTYSFTVKSTDQRNASIAETFQLLVNDVNEVPYDIVLSDSVIWETLNQIEVGELTASDDDQGHSLSFELNTLDEAADNQYFTIQGNKLYVNLPVNFNDTLAITIRVTDNGGLSSTTSKHIVVNRRTLSISNDNIRETLDTTYVGEFGLAETATSGSLSFKILDQESTDFEKFFIESSALYANDISIYDYDSLRLHIEVSDEGNLRLEREFTFSVMDINFAPVELLLSSNKLDVNSEVGTVIGVLSTVDPDSSDTHSYEIGNSAFFNIEEDKLVSASLFESTEPININIISRDQDGLLIEKQFQIDLTGELEEELPLANKKEFAKLISIFPNPSERFFYINSSIKIKQLSIYDASGKFIRKHETFSRIDMNNLKPGMYYIKLVTEKGVVFKSIVKK